MFLVREEWEKKYRTKFAMIVVVVWRQVLLFFFVDFWLKINFVGCFYFNLYKIFLSNFFINLRRIGIWTLMMIWLLDDYQRTQIQEDFILWYIDFIQTITNLTHDLNQKLIIHRLTKYLNKSKERNKEINK